MILSIQKAEYFNGKYCPLKKKLKTKKKYQKKEINEEEE